MTTSPPTAIAKAFGVGIDHHPEVVARFRERWSEQDLNEARLRMARIPDGAELIQSATILAPGFKLGNVIVMAGVPSIMQAMMDIVAPKLKSGVRMLSETVRANAREGDIGGPLREIAKAHPDTIIGSYPFIDEEQQAQHQPRGALARSGEARRGDGAVKEMLAGLKCSALKPHRIDRTRHDDGERSQNLSAQERAGKAFPVSWDQFHRDCRALTWRLNGRPVPRHRRDHPRRPGAGGDRGARARRAHHRYGLRRELRPHQAGRAEGAEGHSAEIASSAAAPARGS